MMPTPKGTNEMKATHKVLVSHRFAANGMQRQIGRVEFYADGKSVIETGHAINLQAAEEILPGFGELLVLSARIQAGKVLREYIAENGRWASVWSEDDGIQCDVYPITPIPDPGPVKVRWNPNNRVRGTRGWFGLNR